MKILTIFTDILKLSERERERENDISDSLMSSQDDLLIVNCFQ